MTVDVNDPTRPEQVDEAALVREAYKIWGREIATQLAEQLGLPASAWLDVSADQKGSP